MPSGAAGDLPSQRAWVAHLRIGALLTELAGLALLHYFHATSARPERVLLALMTVAAMVGAAIIAALAPSIHRRRQQTAVVSGWVAATISLLAVGAAVDGGVSSPITPMLALPVVYSALQCTLARVVGAAAMATVALGMLQPWRSTSTRVLEIIAVELLCLLAVGAARNRERQEHAVRALTERLHELALRDELTGLANRRALLERLTLEADRSTRTCEPLAVLVLDLDGFKAVNDRHGHTRGDDVLRRVASVLDEQVRSLDLCGRLGGDEFAVILVNTNLDDAERVAERIAAAVADSCGPAVTASIGVAQHDLDADPIATVNRADSALYEAKRRGGNRVALASVSSGHPENGWPSVPGSSGYGAMAPTGDRPTDAGRGLPGLSSRPGTRR